jgi:6-phosphogluconolactonase (cycloisomerase 2 family)
MEIKQRMSKRYGWLLGIVVLVTIGLLVACGSSYNSSSDGLLLVGSQGSGLIETFSFNLFNGHFSAVDNTPINTSNQVCVLNGVPTSIVVNPAGTFAYAVINARSDCPNSKTGILTFKINSNGTTAVTGSLVPFNKESVSILGTTTPVSAPVVPSQMVMDPAGKFLFVADRTTTTPEIRQSPPPPAPPLGPYLYLPGAVSVFAIGSGGSLTEVTGSPFFTTGTTNPPTTVSQSSIDIVSVAPTPTVFPAIGVNGLQNAVCSAPGISPPTTQFLYAVDGVGNQVFEFQVNTSSGALTNPSTLSSVPSFATDQTPAGVAVDACNRFVYVSDSLTNKVSAYTICNGSPTQSTTCTTLQEAGALVQVTGSPFSLSGSTNPGPLVVDPYGNNVYVLGLDSNTVSPLKISPISGSLTPLTPATVATGLQPVAMTIRGDDNWLFVSNYNAATVSQYSITPATGQLSVQPTIPTDNYPLGVAVK